MTLRCFRYDAAVFEMWRCGVHLETVRLRIGISATRLQNQGQGIVPPGLVTSERSCGTLSPSKGRKAGCHPAWWRACQNVRWYALRLTMGTLCVLQKPEKTKENQKKQWVRFASYKNQKKQIGFLWFFLVFFGFIWTRNIFWHTHLLKVRPLRGHA